MVRGDDVQAIIDRARRRAEGTTPAARTAARVAAAAPAGAPRPGLYPDVERAVAAAVRAFAVARDRGLEARKQMIVAIRASMREHAAELAAMARAETGLGRVEDKVTKNLLVIDKTPGPEDLEPTMWSGDDGLTVVEYAPFGVIGAITPVTNPTSTIINNSIAALAAGNTVVFNVHPSAKRVSAYNVELVNRAVLAAGGPPDLVTAVAEPSIASAQQLMNDPRVRILLVTGGPAVVAEARKTGKRAILAGPGNPPVVVDASADLALAAREIVRGASFDNNVVCIDEKVLFVVAAVADELKRRLATSGAYLVKPFELARLEREIFTDRGQPGRPGHVNPRWIGQNAGDILAAVGVTGQEATRLVVAEVPGDHPLVWTEQMMPVLPLVRLPTVDAAIAAAVAAERGNGHTASIYSSDVGVITKMAREANVSIFVVNAANVAGLGAGGEGYTSFSIASPTGEGLTRPRSFSRERRMTVAGGLRIV